MAINASLLDMVLPAKCEFDNLAKSAANIALLNFKWEYVTFILYNTALVCGIHIFIDKYGKPIVIGKHSLYPVVPTYTRQIIVFGINLQDIRNMLEWMKKYKMDNNSKCIIVCESYKSSCNEFDAVNLLWEFQITNVIFLKYLSSNVVAGYTYFYGKNCTATPPVQAYKWDFQAEYKNHSGYNMFPLKFKNLYGCPLIVSTFIQKPYMDIQDNVPSGADGDFLLIIVKAIKATFKLMTPRLGAGWGYLDTNGTWVGSLGDLYIELANFSMTSAAITLSRHKDFQISKNYYSLYVVWVTHPVEVQPASMKLLRPLSIKTRIALFVSIFITIILVLLLKHSFCLRIRTKMHLEHLPNGLLLQCWEIHMGQPVTEMPKKMALTYLVLLWIWYCFLVRTFYQVYLIDSLKNDIYLKGFVDIEDAIKEGYGYGGGPALNDYYLDSPDIHDNWINIESNDIYKTMFDLSNGKKFVLAMNLATEQIFIKETNRKLFVLPGKIISTHSVLFFKKYSPLESALSRIVTQLFECGWPQKIYMDNTIQICKTIVANDHRPIKLEHFTGCYIIIMTGWLISLCSFVAELCVFKKNVLN